MWPFGKKKEKEHIPTPQELQVQEFAQQFLPEEFTLVAVTAPEGVSDRREEGKELWILTMPLTAWMDEADGVVSTESAALQILADEQLRSYLHQRLPGNFIIKAKVRAAKEGGVFQLVGMPEPGFDPELKAILNEQVKPVTLETEDLGTFTLIRSMNWFEQQVDWLDQTVQITFSRAEDAEQQNSLATARTLLAGAQEWDARIRDLAADRLLETVNEASEEECVSREELRDSLFPETILAAPDGNFTAWYGSDLFFGRAARITGSLSQGPFEAQMEEE